MQSNVIEVTEKRTGIAHAVKLAGGQVPLAESLGVSQQAIGQWLARGFVPLGRSVEIEALYGIPRAKLINPHLADLVDLPGADE